VLCNGCRTIIRNLRFKYGDNSSKIDDEILARRFDDWNLSDKSEEEIQWLLRIGNGL